MIGKNTGVVAALLALSMVPASAAQRTTAASSLGARAQAARLATGARALPLSVASRDDERNVPSFVWLSRQAAKAPGATWDAKAKWVLQRSAPLWRLGPGALATAEVVGVHDRGRGGVVVRFRQTADRVEVFGDELKVLFDRSGRPVAISGRLSPGAVPGVLKKLPAWRAGAADVVAAALTLTTGVSVRTAQLVDDGHDDAGLRVDLAASATRLTMPEPARARRVLFPLGDAVVPAWRVELLAGVDGGAATGHLVVIAATDGRVLLRHGLTHSEAFTYRVWADPADSRPMDGPHADYTPHPTGLPDGSAPAFIPSLLVTVDGLNTNPDGQPDPWLPAGATQTRGNNVDAYSDHDNSDDAGGDLRATTTAAGQFDRLYDTSLEPMSSPDQVMAAVTQIFYVTNYLHDWWYDSGFDEASGNGQEDNYGRGGTGGDPLLAEAQDDADGGSRNNANMSSMSEGISPRMQMYLWEGRDQRTLDVQPSGTTLSTNTASFGAKSFEVTATLEAAADASGASLTDGCETLTGDLTGKIALIDRGTCPFTTKAQNAQDAGALGVIIANNQAGGAPTLGSNNPPAGLTVPCLSVSQADGASLRTQLAAGAVTVHMLRIPSVERDGTIDNGIVAHEWGHYIHGRLVACFSTQCGGQGEGWGDFIALHMAVSEGDDLDGVYAMAGYSTANMSDNNHYFGIRRIPYSVDFSRNDLTFRHIADDQSLPTDIPFIDFGGPNSEVHNAGEIWASMMFEAMVALLKESQGATPRLSFAEAHRRIGDYVVAGMLLAPQAPTFTEQRDAILAAALANDEADFLVLATAFARRGAGTGARSPARQSDDLIGVVESFDVLGDLAVVDVALRDALDSCDGDGLLDHGETGTVSLSIMNPGAATLTGTTLNVTSATAGVTFPDGGTVTVPDLGPFDSFTTEVAVALAADATAEEVSISYSVANPAAATPEVAGTLTVRVHYDNLPASSSSDDVESDVEAWVEDGNLPAWAREAESDGNHVWRGEAPGELADVSLVSPPLMVGGESFTIVFRHRHQFEQSDGTNWDGGVIELSRDDGATWLDISSYATPGYGGPLTGESGNPLADRQAFVGQSAAFPALAGVSLDLGTALAGQTVRVRFRVATDAAVGDLGWTLDDLVFGGLLNTPFPTTPLDDGVCTGAPRASAGPDRAVFAGANVRLDGSASEDTDGGVLSFSWAQTGGDEVALTGADGATPTFVAPLVTESTPLTFTLTVSDGDRIASDSVTINVTPRLGPGGDGDDEGGCGCRVGGERPVGAGALGAALLGIALVLVARRRR